MYSADQMVRSLIERRLFEVSKRLQRAQEDLVVVDEQLGALTEAAEDARMRSLVSETPLATREHAEAERHAEAMRSARRAMEAKVSSLQAELDELLDRLITEAP